MADLGCVWQFGRRFKVLWSWAAYKPMAYMLHFRSVCDTTAPLQLQFVVGGAIQVMGFNVFNLTMALCQ